MDFDLDKYKKFLKTRYLGRNLIYLEKTDSTNSFASKLIKKKAENRSGTLKGTVVLAKTQLKGRGRFDRKWISPEGGLWFTLILETGLEPKNFAEVTLIAAYSIVNILDRDYKINAEIKWPNDIYYKKLKLGGILTEAEKIGGITYLLIGIGLNANLTKVDLAPYGRKSVSIKIILGKDIEREIILSKILFNIEEDYEYYSQTKDFKTIFKKIEKRLKFI